MCTVTYLPYHEKGFILTSSRDESPLRQTSVAPVREIINGQEITYPKDQKAGGTWVASAEKATLCLLNGAFEKHRHQPLYRHSRGRVVLDYFQFEDTDAFLSDYKLTDIEPFTLVIVEEQRLLEMRWDEQRRHVREWNRCEPRLWSSVTLYDELARKKRDSWFREWLAKHPHYSIEDIRHFHRTGGEGDAENSILMNRQNLVRTVSLTSIWQAEDSPQMWYEGLLATAPVF